MKRKSNELSANKQGRIYKIQGGCNEDCFHCKYPDCFKPIKYIELKSPFDSRVDKINNNTGSEQIYSKMFTLELGNMGRNTPNLSKKFWL